VISEVLSYAPTILQIRRGAQVSTAPVAQTWTAPSLLPAGPPYYGLNPKTFSQNAFTLKAKWWRTMAGSKPVGSSTLLKTELKRIFDEGLLLSSYNIYSQFMPWQMEAFILELVALEIAYHAGGESRLKSRL
jgi:hypothetical protein